MDIGKKNIMIGQPLCLQRPKDLIKNTIYLPTQGNIRQVSEFQVQSKSSRGNLPFCPK